MMSLTLVRYVLSAAFRDRLLLVLALIVLLSAAIGAFVGSGAVTEKDRFSLVFSTAGIRFGAMAALVLFIVFYIRRAFEGREVEFLLSRPISRTSFVISHCAAFSILAILMAVIIAVGVNFLIVGPGHAALPLWSASLAAEFVIMANAAFFFSMVLTSATAGAMATLGLYILGRLMGQILGVINNNELLPGYHLLSLPAKTISLLVPRLDLLAQSSWLVYGTDHSAGWLFVVAQGAIFTMLLIAAALIDLLRRQF